jgi:hypothetical protein
MQPFQNPLLCSRTVKTMFENIVSHQLANLETNFGKNIFISFVFFVYFLFYRGKKFVNF